MDYHKEQTADTDVEKQLNIPISRTKEIPTTSDDDITPYQKPAKEPLLNGTPVPHLSDDPPDHVYEDLYGYWRSHSHYQSRVRILEGFATDGPFPSITSFGFKEDPQTGLTRKFVDELEVATMNFKETICQIHANNYQHLATNEIEKINTLVHEAKTIYSNTLIQLQRVCNVPENRRLITQGK